MAERPTLAAHLADWAKSDPTRLALASAVGAVAVAAMEIAQAIADSALAGHLGAAGNTNVQGEEQKKLDVLSDEILVRCLKGTSVAAAVSEEDEKVIPLNPQGTLLMAFDPLDGSSNIDVNVSVGTIFSITPAPGGRAVEAADFLKPGRVQLGAGFVVYGPATMMVLTLGAGTMTFALDRRSGEFRLHKDKVEIAPKTKEYAINASNARHWAPPIKAYIDECLAGKTGARGEDCNMRWVASMVADLYRVISRGGVFLYPGDQRAGYEQGRLRLLYECNPIAFVVEQAGGIASTGTGSVLDVVPTGLHQRVPFIAGSRDEVARVLRFCQ